MSSEAIQACYVSAEGRLCHYQTNLDLRPATPIELDMADATDSPEGIFDAELEPELLASIERERKYLGYGS